ncbi:MAG: hypothetical protein LUO97_04445, partial [Methanomicrobiales archaeon]|nr:hypothetical protein [Methanomicrobiales archaeon]
MEIRSSILDVALTLILVISTIVLMIRYWQDVVMVTAATLMMLSLAGLFLSMGRKIQRLDASVVQRERTIRVNLEEISTGMARKFDSSVDHVNGVIQEL